MIQLSGPRVYLWLHRAYLLPCVSHSHRILTCLEGFIFLPHFYR